MFKGLTQIEIRKFTAAFEKSTITLDNFIIPTETIHTQDEQNNWPIEVYEITFKPNKAYFFIMEIDDTGLGTDEITIRYKPGRNETIVVGTQPTWNDAIHNERDFTCLTSWLDALEYEKESEIKNISFFNLLNNPANSKLEIENENDLFSKEELSDLIPNSIRKFKKIIFNNFDLPIDLREKLAKLCDQYISKLTNGNYTKSDYFTLFCYRISEAIKEYDAKIFGAIIYEALKESFKHIFKLH